MTANFTDDIKGAEPRDSAPFFINEEHRKNFRLH